MASYTSRWTYAPTGYPQPYTDSEKGPQSPLLVSVPGYDTANLAAPPNPQAAPPRRSQTRKFWVRAGHFLLLTLFFVFVAPSLYRRAKSYMTQGGTMHGIPAFASSHPDCVENARWSNHDEELERDYGLDVHPHNFRHLVKTSFNLPLDSELLYFLARGTMSHGSIEVKDDGENGDDNVVVDVSLLYVSDVALEKVEVCHLHRENTKNGVGNILT